jgi:Undecaprenyl-phosphate glucose phosphotransferase
MLILGSALALVLMRERLGSYGREGLISKKQHPLRLHFCAFVMLAAGALVLPFDNLLPHRNLLPHWIAHWLLAAVAGIWLWTVVFAWLVGKLSAAGDLLEQIAVVGTAEDARVVVGALSQASPQIHVMGTFHEDLPSPGANGGPTHVGSIDDLITRIRSGQVDRVVIALPPSPADRIAAIVERLEVISIDVDLALKGGPIAARYARTAQANLPLIRVAKRPLSTWQFVIKVLADKVLATAILLFTAPLMIAIAFAVRISSAGPVLFRQQRTGFNNEEITVLKFRTLYSRFEDSHAEQVVTRGDLRVTPLGRVLRKFSLDELPQLINVLRGDMSIVGPRPHPCFLKVAGRPCDEARGYMARHRVRPGITGLAQINGWRGEMDTIEKLERRLEHDLTYIENWSLMLDLKILGRTALAVLRLHDAY